MERWGGGECGEGVGKVQRYNNGVYQYDVCGMRQVGGLRKNQSVWWNEEVSCAEAEKRRAFEYWLQRRDRATQDVLSRR